MQIQHEDDILEQAIAVEQSVYNSGLTQGIEKGAQDGHQEGFVYGLDQGRKLGEEIGEMIGFTKTLQALISQEQSHPQNLLRVSNNTLRQLNDLLQQFPWENPANEENDLLNLVDQLRNKYKLLQIRIGLKSTNSSNTVHHNKNQNFDF